MLISHLQRWMMIGGIPGITQVNVQQFALTQVNSDQLIIELWVGDECLPLLPEGHEQLVVAGAHVGVGLVVRDLGQVGAQLGLLGARLRLLLALA